MRFDPYAVDPGVEDGAGHGELSTFAREVSVLLAQGDGPDDPGDRVGPALDLARTWGARLPLPGEGLTLELWQQLAEVAAADLTVVRVLEPHLDALAVLAQAAAAGHPVPGPVDGTWGVFAAEGPGARLEASEEPDGTWRLTGRKPWCSLASRLDAALVTAWCGPRQRRLYAVDLRTPEVRPDPDPGWVARGLAEVVSGPVDFVGARAVPVGPAGWYLDRPGFAWGGMGVAACWVGGAAGLARSLEAATARREPDQVAHMHLGAVDASLHAAGATLALAARAVDGAAAQGPAGAALALRVRHTARVAAEEVLHRAAHALGPAPLATDEGHARRVADLQLYLRQEHAERDESALGRALGGSPGVPPTVWSAP